MTTLRKQQLNQDMQQPQAPADKDPGPEITLAEFIAAIFGLDSSRLYYNRFGRLSPLPPQAQELYMLLAKRMKIISKDTFGCTVEFGNEKCTNIRIKNITRDCKFHVIAYLRECNNISINRSQNFLKRRLSRLKIYSKTEHVSIYLLMTVTFTAVYLFVNFASHYTGRPSYDFPDSLNILTLAGISSSLAAYIFSWEGVAEFLEDWFNKSKFEHQSDLDEIRLKVISSSKSKEYKWNETCTNIFSITEKHLNTDNCKEYVLAKLKDEINLRQSKEYEIHKLSSEIKSKDTLIEQAQEKISKLKTLNQALTEENAKILSSNLTLKTQTTQLSEQNNIITQENTRLSLTNKELKLKSANLDNALEQNKTLKNTITQLETTKPDAASLDTYKKLSYCLLFLYCESLIGKNIPQELQKIKNTKDILTGISSYLDTLRSEDIVKFKGLSRSNIYNLFKDSINLSFKDIGIDPRLIHKHYDGSIDLVEKIYKNNHQSH